MSIDFTHEEPGTHILGDLLNLRLGDVNVFVVDKLAIQRMESSSVCWLRYSDEWEAAHDVPRQVEYVFAF